jgi:2-oxoisovalerate dehydrogenase E1 component alpha subunit
MPVQLLTPQGERVDHPDWNISLTGAQMRDLYRDMVLVRAVDLAATALQRQGELGLWASSLGQEAAQIGSARALRPSDFAFPTYREVGVTWARGIDPVDMLQLYRGITHGGWDPRIHGCNPYTIVIGNQALHAVGYAMGITLDDGDDVAIGYFGDGATSEGDVNEAFVFASIYQAPVILFCQNNEWAISHPFSKQSRTSIAHRASGFGIPGIQVDGNDVLAVYAVTQKAIENARTGQGPTVIEALTYRMASHTTSDDPTRYREADEVEMWQQRDPIMRLELYLRGCGEMDEAFQSEIRSEADELAERIRSGVRAMVDPSPEHMFDHVYAEPHDHLVEQRAALLAYEAQFAQDGSS